MDLKKFIYETITNSSNEDQLVFTLNYIEGNELKYKPKEYYNSIQECIDWADKYKISYYLLRITQWSNYFTNYADIDATVNLQIVVDDNETENIERYSNY